MVKENGIRELKTALGLSVSMLSSEHVFSASLSSPWTTGKLTSTQEDKNAFWRLFTEAAIASVAFSLIIGFLLQDWWAFIASVAGSLAIIIWMYFDYSRALSGELYY